MSDDPTASARAAKGRSPAAIEWNDAEMKSSYSNISNVASTREEVSVFFGTNETWQAGAETLEVKLQHRILMSPFAAKRLHLLLSNVIREYESRFGEIRIDAEGARGGNGDAARRG